MIFRKFAILFLLFFALMAIIPQRTSAQEKERIPPFRITLANGQFFSATDIAKGRPVVLIYFAPDCDHCHTLMNAFFKKADGFRGVEVIMVTYKPVSEVSAFVRAFGVAQYPNIKVGTEGTTNYLRLFYRLQNTPFTALYDKKGKLVKTYRKEPRVDNLLAELGRL